MARPSYTPTTAQRKAVRIAAGAGMSHAEIALALGISRSTLEKVCACELGAGAGRARMDVLIAMHACAMRGSASAQRVYLSLARSASALPAPRLGKKAAAARAAREPSGDAEWDALLAPIADSVQ